MRLLFLGDVFGKPGREAVTQLVPDIVREERVDVVVINAENAASGSGLTPDMARELLRHAQLLTGGNHIWARREILDYLDREDARVIRPMNYPQGAAGRGFTIVRHGEHTLGVINLEGRVFMKPLDDPFRAADEAVEALQAQGVRSILVDVHAEATSEKAALAYYLDGRVSAVIGTHTHVQTADERVLPQGTAFLTDAGMCGPQDSIIGVKKELALARMLTQRPGRFEPAESEIWVNGALVDIDARTGRATDIRRVQRRLPGS